MTRSHNPERCEMIEAHHSDCECALCRANEDAYCGTPAVGYVDQGTYVLRVCDEHAKMAADDPDAYGELTRYREVAT
jgi:hypothetical protein